jgi:hypothetical protein
MHENEQVIDAGGESAEADEASAIWEHLSPEQKKYFKKLVEKNEENMNYIG